MNDPARSSPLTRNATLAIAMIASSVLMYEILLTRVSSLKLFFHFGFLVISNCLLGVGASGVLISIFQDRMAERRELFIWLSSLVYVASLLLVYPLLIGFDFDVEFTAASVEFTRFSIFNAVAAIPFFTGGGAVGMLLSFNAARVNRVYFFDLVGAGLGCLLCPLFLWLSGAGGSFVVLTLFGVAGAMLTAPGRWRRPALIGGATLWAVGLAALPWADQRFPVSAKSQIQLTENLRLDLPEERYSRWSALSRIDLVPIPSTTLHVFGRGKKKVAPGLEPIEQRLILQDGWAGTFLVNFSDEPDALRYLESSLYAAASRLKDDPRVFVIGVGGGHDLWGALLGGASRVKGVELNQQVVDIHREVVPHFSKALLDDSRVELVQGEGRSTLMRESEVYDVIQMTGIDTWASLTSGGYMLAENYLYTVDALRLIFDRLAPDGVVQISRLGLDMESLRLFANFHEAFKTHGSGAFADSIACLGARGVRSVIAKKRPFTAEELARLHTFADEGGFNTPYLPNLPKDNLLNQFTHSDDKDAFIRNFPRRVTPTTDDLPYFFNFTRWDRPTEAVSYVGEPSFVSQGDPLLLFAQLGLSAIACVVLILLPVFFAGPAGFVRRHLLRFGIYFAGVGLGFIALEIVLMQKLVLFLGHPLYSLVVTLFSLLVFTGLGSLLSERWFEGASRRAWAVPIALAIYLALFIGLSEGATAALIGLPSTARIALTVAVLAPIGILLGIPFAYGIRLVNRHNPTLVPWGWAINACASVIGSIGSVILSMNFGFTVVLIAACAIYFATFLAVHPLMGAAASSR